MEGTPRTTTMPTLLAAGQDDDLLSSRECLLPRLSGIGQDNNGRGALQPVKGDPPSRSGLGQDEVADVQLSRRNGTGGHHQALSHGLAGSGRVDVMVPPTTDSAEVPIPEAGSAHWGSGSARRPTSLLNGMEEVSF